MSTKSRFSNYVLAGHQPVRCDSVLEWARWFEKADRHVASTEQDDVRVSTVFLGLDHSFGRPGPPLLFETMVFRGTTEIDVGGEKREIAASSDRAGEFARYSSWDDAEAGHAAICKRVFGKSYQLVK